ncbi:putative stress-response A/B barrel domain-containing protein HS1/DABB1 [Helianthus debilis subsp. tardiflorus]
MEMLRQGFTHALMMTFGSKDDFNAFQAHPNHVEYSATFSAAIDKIVLLDFPVVSIKPSSTCQADA